MRFCLFTCLILMSMCCYAQNRKADGTIDSTYKHGIQVKANKLTWSYDGCLLFRSDEHAENWRVVKAFEDIYIMDLYPIDDNTVILWDADGYSYFKYSLKDNTTKSFLYKQPLKKFLAYPVKSITLSEHFPSCVSDERDVIQYSQCGENMYCLDLYARGVYDGIVKEKKLVAYEHAPVPIRWQDILGKINTDHSVLPKVADLEFSAQDRNKYLAMVDSMAGKIRNRTGFLHRGTFVIDTAFYRNIIYSLDTLNSRTMIRALSFPDKMTTSSLLFRVHITNENNDTLIIEHREWSDSYRALFFPWRIKYHELEFYSYDVQLSRNIAKLLPEIQQFNKPFDNSSILLTIVDHLYEQKIR